MTDRVDRRQSPGADRSAQMSPAKKVATELDNHLRRLATDQEIAQPIQAFQGFVLEQIYPRLDRPYQEMFLRGMLGTLQDPTRHPLSTILPIPDYGFNSASPEFRSRVAGECLADLIWEVSRPENFFDGLGTPHFPMMTMINRPIGSERRPESTYFSQHIAGILWLLTGNRQDAETLFAQIYYPNTVIDLAVKIATALDTKYERHFDPGLSQQPGYERVADYVRQELEREYRSGVVNLRERAFGAISMDSPFSNVLREPKPSALRPTPVSAAPTTAAAPAITPARAPTRIPSEAELAWKQRRAALLTDHDMHNYISIAASEAARATGVNTDNEWHDRLKQPLFRELARIVLDAAKRGELPYPLQPISWRKSGTFNRAFTIAHLNPAPWALEPILKNMPLERNQETLDGIIGLWMGSLTSPAKVEIPVPQLMERLLVILYDNDPAKIGKELLTLDGPVSSILRQFDQDYGGALSAAISELRLKYITKKQNGEIDAAAVQRAQLLQALDEAQQVSEALQNTEGIIHYTAAHPAFCGNIYTGMTADGHNRDLMLLLQADGIENVHFELRDELAAATGNSYSPDQTPAAALKVALNSVKEGRKADASAVMLREARDHDGKRIITATFLESAMIGRAIIRRSAKERADLTMDPSVDYAVASGDVIVLFTEGLPVARIEQLASALAVRHNIDQATTILTNQITATPEEILQQLAANDVAAEIGGVIRDPYDSINAALSLFNINPEDRDTVYDLFSRVINHTTTPEQARNELNQLIRSGKVSKINPTDAGVIFLQLD